MVLNFGGKRCWEDVKINYEEHCRPLRQGRAPVSEVMVATNEEDLAARLEARA